MKRYYVIKENNNFLGLMIVMGETDVDIIVDKYVYSIKPDEHFIISYGEIIKRQVFNVITSGGKYFGESQIPSDAKLVFEFIFEDKIEIKKGA